jgi:type IV pilus assembly protein PilX
MAFHRTPSPRAPQGRNIRHAQRGVILLYGLIVLAIMLIGAAAMVRSMNTSLVNAGNIGFKRDITNQAERASATVLTLMQTGALATVSARQASSTASNYSATILATNAQGLPNVLVDDTGFATVGVTSNDIAVTDQAITLRWVVDRLCVNTGVADASHCTMANDPSPVGGSGSDLINAIDTTSGGAGALARRVVYRVSIRVTGPRSTQAFFQTTLTL